MDQVSPYLLRPLRGLEEVFAEIAAQASMATGAETNPMETNLPPGRAGETDPSSP